MQSDAKTAAEYIENLPEDRKESLVKLRNVILKSLPKGFEEVMGYGMLCYVVPHSIYPKGYHCDAKLPLPFISIASQKNFIAFYHMLLSDKNLLDWFVTEFPKHSKYKLDMGKCCVRFKNVNAIPYDLLGLLASKVTVEEWVTYYERGLKK